VGFMAVGEIARRRVFSSWRERFNGEVAEGHLGGERTLLLKPMTFMNESSRAVGEAVHLFDVFVRNVRAHALVYFVENLLVMEHRGCTAVEIAEVALHLVHLLGRDIPML